MKDKNNRILLSLFLSFLKIGAFTFGGGYAMIPLIQKEIADDKKWITPDEILESVAIAESTPGPIAVNAATFTGYTVCGFWGAVCATLGVVLPSFVIIIAVSFVLGAFMHLKVIQYAFLGIRAGILALILRALFQMVRLCPKNITAYVIAFLAFVLSAFTHFNVLFVIIGSAAAGLLHFLMITGRYAK